MIWEWDLNSSPIILLTNICNDDDDDRPLIINANIKKSLAA